MKKNRKYIIIYFLTAAICYVCSVIWFVKSRSALGAMWLCIGSANLCLGVSWVKKCKDENCKEADKSDESQK